LSYFSGVSVSDFRITYLALEDILMKIAIDARFAVHNRRGIGNYTLKLINNLAKTDFRNEYILYTDRDDNDHVLPQGDNFKIKKLSPANYFVWEQIILPIQAKKDSVEILHCTGNTAPIFLDKRIRLVSTIHDVMFLKDYSQLPKSASLRQRAGRIYRKIIVPRTIKHLSLVLTVSEFSKGDILKHIPNLAHERIKTIHEAANENYRCIDKTSVLRKLKNRFGIDGSYILTLGALDPRKNTELVINQYIGLRNANKMNEKLLIVGIPNGKQTKFYNIVRESYFKDDIIFIDFVSEEDLVFLYNGAAVFLYPSSYEGFGIPPLEAMACGVPVVTSNTTSIPEIVGNAALMINPENGEELKAALIRILNEEGLRHDLISRGLEQVKKFSWMRLARETLSIYESVYRR
jgi:glycosyltransferase involved in cell wall biosynthesis